MSDFETRLHTACRAAIAKWGPEAQLAHAAEELAELIVELSHHRRMRVGDAAVVSEIADVHIMLQQVVFALDIDEDDIAQALEAKLTRLVAQL